MVRPGLGEPLDLEGPHTLMKKMRDSRRGLSQFFPATPLQKGREKTGLSFSISSDASGSTVRDARRAHTDLGFLFGRNREGGKHANPPGYDRYYTAVWDGARGTTSSWDPCNQVAKKEEKVVFKEEKGVEEECVKENKGCECASMDSDEKRAEEESGSEEKESKVSGSGELSQRTQDLKKQVEDLRDSVFSSKCRNLLGLAGGRAAGVGGGRRGVVAGDVMKKVDGIEESEAYETRSESCYVTTRKSVLQDLKWDSTPRDARLVQGNSPRESHSAPQNLSGSAPDSSDVEGANDGGNLRESGTGSEVTGGGEDDFGLSGSGKNPSSVESRVSTRTELGFSSNCSFSHVQEKCRVSGDEKERGVHGEVAASFVSLPSHFYSLRSGITVTGSCEGVPSTEELLSARDVRGEGAVRGDEKPGPQSMKRGCVVASVSTVETPSRSTSERTDTDDLSHSYRENEAAPVSSQHLQKLDKSTAMSMNIDTFKCSPEVMVLRDAGNIKASDCGGEQAGIRARASVTPETMQEQEVEKDWLPQLVPQALLQSFGINGLVQGTATKLPDQFHLHLHFPHKDVLSLSSGKEVVTSRQAISSTALVPQQGQMRTTEAGGVDRSLSQFIADTQCAEETKSAFDDGDSSWAALRVLCKTMDETVQVACQKLSEGDPEQDRSKDESWDLHASHEKQSNARTTHPIKFDAGRYAGGGQHLTGKNLNYKDEQYYTEGRGPNTNTNCGQRPDNANRPPKWLESWLASQIVDESFIESDIIDSNEGTVDHGNYMAPQQGTTHKNATQESNQFVNKYGSQDQTVPSWNDFTPARCPVSKSPNMRALELRQNPNLYKDGFAAGTMRYRHCKDQTQWTSGISGHSASSAEKKPHQTTSEVKQLDTQWQHMPTFHASTEDTYRRSPANTAKSKAQDFSTQNLPAHHTQSSHGMIKAAVSNKTGSDYSIPGSLSASAIERSIDEADAEWRKRQAELLRKVKNAGAGTSGKPCSPIKEP